MKTNIFGLKNRTTLGLGLALLLGSFGIAQAQPSPVGTWDCALVNPWKGTAYITFGSDFTINGIQIMTSPPRSTNSYDVNPNGYQPNPRTNIYGGAIIADGEWHFEGSKVIGFYTENYYVGTNLVVTPVSFEATVNPGKKINIKAIVGGRSASLKGVPAAALPNISGSYYGDGRSDGVSFKEFFTLTLSDPLNNYYDLVGQGPGYTFTGFALLSKKTVSFYSVDNSTNQVLRAVTGPMNTGKGTASTKGLQGDGGDKFDKVYYKVTKQPNPPPPPPAE